MHDHDQNDDHAYMHSCIIISYKYKDGRETTSLHIANIIIHNWIAYCGGVFESCTLANRAVYACMVWIEHLLIQKCACTKHTK